MTRIRKAVLPVAGLGTRVLPATKSLPKEMLPVFDRPAIQYVVDEAKAAGIEHFVFVTGRNKGSIEDYFDHAFELEETLRKKNRTALLEELHAVEPAAGACSFVRQQKPLGLGHAVWCARHVLGDEPFAVLLPDMLMRSEAPCLKQMVDAHQDLGGNLVSIQEVPANAVSNYGIADLGERYSDTVWRLQGMVEKPQTNQAPSRMMISGRYILEPEIFDLLERQSAGAGGEIQLTDAMVALMGTRPFHALEYRGQTYDTGSKLGYLEAFVSYALADPEYAETGRAIIERVLTER